MAYSKKIESDFRELARDNFRKALFSCKTPEEMDAFCSLLHSAINSEISHDIESIEGFDKNLQVKEQLSNLLELASNDGFDIYATDEIIDLKNIEYSSRFENAERTNVQAFISHKISRGEQIAEAKAEFIAILRDELYKQLGKIVNLSRDKKLEEIKAWQKDREQSRRNQQEMAMKQPPQPNSEAHVESEEVLLRRMEQAFQHEERVNITGNRVLLRHQRITELIETNNRIEQQTSSRINSQTRNCNNSTMRGQFFVRRASQLFFNQEDSIENSHDSLIRRNLSR